MSQEPEELKSYLQRLISPPEQVGPVLIIEDDLSQVDFASYADSSVHGLITKGNPEKYFNEIDRVLRPGAHVLLISEQDDINFEGTCALEDRGYEVRDSICLLDSPEDEFLYTTKASKSERNAGVPEYTNMVEQAVIKDGLSDDLYADILSHLEENGFESGNEDAYKSLKGKKIDLKLIGKEHLEHFDIVSTVTQVVQNNHPTVKPISIMEFLMRDLPQGCLVVDPFMGSGTTGIACVRTNHQFVGIEREAEYIRIADARVRHVIAEKLDSVVFGIVSEAPASPSPMSQIEDDLNELFG